MRTFRAFIATLLVPTFIFAQGRTFSPTLRATSSVPLSIAQVDGNFTGLANVGNGAARTFTAASQAAMLALNPNPQQGDFCERTDTASVWAFLGGDPTNLANWQDPLASAVPTSRLINTTAGQLTGGGALSSNLTLGLATTAVSPSSYGTALLSPTFTVDAYGRLTAAGTATPSYVPSGTSAVTTTIAAKLQRIVNAEDYGAVGDGSSHPLSGITSFNGQNTTGWTLLQWQAVFPIATALTNEVDWCAIQSAINANSTSVIRLLSKSYKSDQSITMSSGTVLAGGGSQVTTITYSGAGTAIVQVTPGTRVYGLGIVGVKITTSTGATGVDLDSVSSGYFSDMLVNGFSSIGISMHSAVSGGVVYNEFINCNAQNCPVGWQIRSTGTNSNRFLNCRANVCSSIGVDWKDGNQNVWLDGQIESCGVGWQVDATSTGTSDSNQVAFTRFEGNTTNFIINSANVRDARVVNNHFVTSASAYTDSGTRTILWANNGVRNQVTSTFSADANGVFLFSASTNVASNTFFNIKDAVSSSGNPVALQIEEDRGVGVSAQGYNGSSIVWKLNANGTAVFTGAVTGVTDSANTNNTDLATTAYVDRTPGSASSSPADPTGTTSTTVVMMGLAGSYTPTKTTRAVFTLQGQMANSTVNDGVIVQLRTGTGSAPTNGAAATGTQRGNQQQHISLVAADTSGFSITFYVSGLTIGTPIWIDAGVRAVTGGTASITGVTITAVEAF